MKLRPMPPQAPIAGARTDKQLGDGFRQFAVQREIYSAIIAGQPLSYCLFAEEPHLGLLHGFAGFAQYLDRHREGWTRRGHRGEPRRGSRERCRPQQPVRLDHERAGRGAAQRGGVFVGRAHDCNRRGYGVALGVASQDLDIAELAEPIEQCLPAHARLCRRDHVIAGARGLAPIAARGEAGII
jgi:hypothetical protein